MNRFFIYIKHLSSIFLTSALWNVCFPFFLGLFLNYKLSDSRTIVIYLVWTTILTIPFVLFKKKIFIFLVWFLTLVFGSLDLIHWVSIKAPVSVYSLYVLFETSTSEAEGFINLKYSSLSIFLLLYIVGSFYLLKKDLRKTYKFNFKFFGFLVLLSIVFLIENRYKNRFIRKGMPLLVQTIISFKSEIDRYKEDTKDIKSFIGKLNAHSLDLENEQITVIVIGESTNRNHMSLYQYFRKTNPLLSKRKDIDVFSDVVSPYTFTQGSIRTSLTSANNINGLKFIDAPSIIAVARAAEYKTFWLSNQSFMGVWDNLISLMAGTSNEILFANKILGSQKVLTSQIYDEILLKPFSEFLNQKNKKKFIVVHLIGTHSAYYKRFPKKFNKFIKLKFEPSSFISYYDNAILYNDYIVNSLIDTLKKYSINNNSLSNLVYFSDHGEIVFDDNFEIAGHDKKGIPSRHQVEIPFLVWQSKKYKKKFPKIYKAIHSNKAKAYNNSNLFHAAIDLMHIQTDLYIDSLSIFNTNFIEKERFIGAQKISYENKILKTLHDK